MLKLSPYFLQYLWVNRFRHTLTADKKPYQRSRDEARVLRKLAALKRTSPI